MSIDTTNLYNSKPDIVKEFYAALLSATAQFVRDNRTRHDVSEYLRTHCRLSANKSTIYGDLYDQHRTGIELVLLNVGRQLPHLTDATCTIDYIIQVKIINRINQDASNVNNY